MLLFSGSAYILSLWDSTELSTGWSIKSSFSSFLTTAMALRSVSDYSESLISFFDSYSSSPASLSEGCSISASTFAFAGAGTGLRPRAKEVAS